MEADGSLCSMSCRLSNFMRKSILLFLFSGLVALRLIGQTVPVNVQKTPGTNSITGSLVIGAGKTLSASGGGSIAATTVPPSGITTGVIPIANIASGTPDGTKFVADDGTLKVPSGGSGTVTHTGSLTVNQVVVGNGTADAKILAAGSNGQVLIMTSGVPAWGAGGSGSPGGSNTQLQYNNSGAFGGISGATTNGTMTTFTGGNLIATSPKIITDISDINGNELLKVTATSSAVNEFTIANAATGSGPTLSATGGDTDVNITISPKGAGTFQVAKKVYFGDAIDTSASVRDFNVISTTGGIALLRTGSASPFMELISRATATGSDIAYWDIYANSNSSNADDLTFRSRTATNDNVLRLTKTIVSVLPTTTSTSTTTGALVVAGGVGIAENLNVGGTFSPSQTSGLVGTTTNNDANAGSVGEYAHSEVPIGSPVSLTTTTGANITSLSLTAGDWEVSGNINFSASTATVTGTSGGITATTGTVPTDGTEVYSGVQVTLLSETDSVTIPPKRFSLSGTTTVYLVGKSTFSAGSVGGFGAIKARRVR